MKRDIVVAFGNAFGKGGGELEVSVLTVRQCVAVPGDKRTGSLVGLLITPANQRGLVASGLTNGNFVRSVETSTEQDRLVNAPPLTFFTGM